MVHYCDRDARVDSDLQFRNLHAADRFARAFLARILWRVSSCVNGGFYHDDDRGCFEQGGAYAVRRRPQTRELTMDHVCVTQSRESDPRLISNRNGLLTRGLSSDGHLGFH